jgi:hypothetical protein
MKHLKTIMRFAGAGLMVVGIFCSVIYGVNALYMILAAGGGLLFILPLWLASRVGSRDPLRAAAPGWSKKPAPAKEPAPAPVGSAEKVVQDLEYPDPEKPTVKISTWLPKGEGRRWIPRLPKARRVWRIPGFRQFKRVAAFVCMILNFGFGEFALTAPGNAAFSIFFLASSFLLADYLWKTRRKPGESPE